MSKEAKRFVAYLEIAIGVFALTAGREAWVTHKISIRSLMILSGMFNIFAAIEASINSGSKRFVRIFTFFGFAALFLILVIGFMRT